MKGEQNQQSQIKSWQNFNNPNNQDIAPFFIPYQIINTFGSQNRSDVLMPYGQFSQDSQKKIETIQQWDKYLVLKNDSNYQNKENGPSSIEFILKKMQIATLAISVDLQEQNIGNQSQNVLSTSFDLQDVQVQEDNSLTDSDLSEEAIKDQNNENFDGGFQANLSDDEDDEQIGSNEQINNLKKLIMMECALCNLDAITNLDTGNEIQSLERGFNQNNQNFFQQQESQNSSKENQNQLQIGEDDTMGFQIQQDFNNEEEQIQEDKKYQKYNPNMQITAQRKVILEISKTFVVFNDEKSCVTQQGESARHFIKQNNIITGAFRGSNLDEVINLQQDYNYENYFLGQFRQENNDDGMGQGGDFDAREIVGIGGVIGKYSSSLLIYLLAYAATLYFKDSTKNLKDAIVDTVAHHKYYVESLYHGISSAAYGLAWMYTNVNMVPPDYQSITLLDDQEELVTGDNHTTISLDMILI